MNKIFRTITKKSKQDKYNFLIKDTENCHMGQKKLLFAEIEFLSYVSKFININDALIVYIGASPGSHINIIRKLFPDSHFLLYDPLKIVMNFNTNVKIHDGKYGYFDDNKCNDVISYKNKINKKYLIYITDIRTRESYKIESSVWNDMDVQCRWGVLMNADFMSIKFRLPWMEKDTDDNLKYILDTSKIEDRLNIKEKILKSGDIRYLSGKIFVQIYANKRSTESRLFVKKNKDGKYNIKTYNCFKYEEKMLYYNVYSKDKEYKFKESKKLVNYLLGYSNSYDSTSEYYIIYKYLKNYKKDIKHYHEMIVNILYDISFMNSIYLVNKFNIFCIFYVYMDFIFKLNDSEKKIENKELIIETLGNYINKFKEYEIKLNNDIINIKENNILNDKKVLYMVNKIIKNKIIYNFNNISYLLLYYNNNISKFIVNIGDIIKINNIIINKFNN